MQIASQLPFDTNNVTVGRQLDLGQPRDSWPDVQPLLVIGDGLLQLWDQLRRGSLDQFAKRKMLTAPSENNYLTQEAQAFAW